VIFDVDFFAGQANSGFLRVISIFLQKHDSFPILSLKTTKPTEFQWVFHCCGAQNKNIFKFVKLLNSIDYQSVFINGPDKYPYMNAINSLQ
jgi:hypothetical protein